MFEKKMRTVWEENLKSEERHVWSKFHAKKN